MSHECLIVLDRRCVPHSFVVSLAFLRILSLCPLIISNMEALKAASQQRDASSLPIATLSELFVVTGKGVVLGWSSFQGVHQPNQKVSGAEATHSRSWG